MLSEEKTYRTRDGSRTGIRVRRLPHDVWFDTAWTDLPDGSPCSWNSNGSWRGTKDVAHAFDLIEEQPAERPFSYDACPVHADGRRRAVTRDGREVVLLCGDGPEQSPVRGWYVSGEMLCRRADGRVPAFLGKYDSGGDLLIPPPPKRVVWVNLYGAKDATQFASQQEADSHAALGWERLGNRAYPIEIDEALR